jgi:hypothetical protein
MAAGNSRRLPDEGTHLRPVGSRVARVLVIGSIIMTTASCASTEWQAIHVARLSSDERTLTVEVTFGSPRDRASQCDHVTATEVEESPSQVIIGIQVRDDCPPARGMTLMRGYISRINLQLKQPLGKRVVVDNTRQGRVKIEWPTRARG